MAKKTLGFIQLVWRCPNCSQLNPGPQKTCTSCGSPQPEDVQFENMPNQELNTDASLAEITKKGADIHCPYCQARNPADAAQCVQCGGELEEGKQRQSGRVVGAFKPGSSEEIPCPTCGTSNPSSNTSCGSCGASMAQSPVQTPPAQPSSVKSPQPSKPVRKRSPLMVVGLISLVTVVAVACIAVILFLTRTSEVTGTVSAKQWKVSVNIEQFLPVDHSDWLESIPPSATVGSCEQKLNRVQDSPEGNYQEVCGTPYTLDTGTGIGEVVQDCRYEIYMEYCQYTVQEWTIVETSSQTGQDSDPVWPDVYLAADQRLGDKFENYTVFFDTEKGQLDYSTHELSEFQSFQPGSIWILEVNTLGSITGYKPK